MPYYVKDRKQGEELIRSHHCSICDGRLYIYIDGNKQLYVSCNLGHSSIEKEYQPRSRGEELERSFKNMTQEDRGVAVAMQQKNLPMTGQLTRPEAMEVLKLVYPGVPTKEIERTAILCHDFGLHPLLKEVYIIPFGTGDKKTWATVLGINATRKMMSRFGSFAYVDNTPRVMTPAEQETIFGEVFDDRITAITKLKTKGGLEAQGYGHWFKKDNPYGTDKGNTKANMAFIRSERQAFSRLFPDHMIPDDVQVVDEAYVEVPEAGKVDRLTGEIQAEEPAEAEFTEIPQEEPEEIEQAVEEEEPTQEEVSKLAEKVNAKLDSELPVGKTGKVIMADLIAIANETRWDVLRYIRDNFHIDTGGTLKEVVGRLTREQQEKLVKEGQDRIDLK